MRQRWCIALRLPVQLRANNHLDPSKPVKIEKGQLWLYQNRPNIFGHYKTDYPQNGFFYLPNEVIFLSNL